MQTTVLVCTVLIKAQKVQKFIVRKLESLLPFHYRCHAIYVVKLEWSRVISSTTIV